MAVASFTGFTQQNSDNDYVKGFLSIPEFKINTVPDSSFYTSAELKKGEPFMMMFFSPDCEHCQRQVKDLMAYKKELAGVQIVMISPLSFKDNKNFYEEYDLNSMPNVKMGTDVTFKLRLLYKITSFPSMYVYDKNGTLAKAFVGNIAVPAILDAVK